MCRKKPLFIVAIVFILAAMLINTASANTLRPHSAVHTKTLNNLFENNDIEKNIDTQLRGYVNGKNIGFFSFRANIEAKDGVTLEMLKMMHVFKSLGADIFCLTGETNMPGFVKGETFKPMHFKGRIKEDFQLDADGFEYTTMFEAAKAIYGTGKLSNKNMAYLMELKDLIKKKIISYIKDNNISILIAENIVYPGNPSFSLACIEALVEIEKEGEHKIDFTFFHNHDYWKERIDRGVPNGTGFVYKMNSMNLISLFDRLKQGLKNGINININTIAKKYVPAKHKDYVVFLPNVMPFEDDKPSPISVTEKSSFKKAFGIPDNAITFILPVRIVKRKNLPCAIDVAYAVQKHEKRPVYILLPHPAGDEGYKDLKELEEYAGKKNIKLIDASKQITEDMGFPLETVYKVADMVIYPSDWEGYGNVFPEAFYYGNIIAAKKYPVLERDIAPTGIQYIEIKEPIDMDTITKISELLRNKKKREEIIMRNYRIGKEWFSYFTLKKALLEGFQKYEQLKKANARAAKSALTLSTYPSSKPGSIPHSIRKNAALYQALNTAA